MLFPSARDMLRLILENGRFWWLLSTAIFIFGGGVSLLLFVFNSAMSVSELRGMNYTYATIVETNVPPPAHYSPALRLHWERSATMIEFTSGGDRRVAMVTTQPASSQGTSIRLWYNAETLGNLTLDSDRGFLPQRSHVTNGLMFLAVGVWMLWIYRRFKSGKLQPVRRLGLGGGRHKGRF